MLKTIAHKVLSPVGCSIYSKHYYFVCQPIRNQLPASIKTFSSNGPNIEDTKLIQLIKLELSHMLDEGARVPQIDSITPYQWEELLKRKSVNARRNYYNFLFVAEKRKQKDKMEKEEKTRAYQQFVAQKAELPPKENGHVEYGLGKTTFLLRVGKGTMSAWRNNRLRQAMQFGEKIIYDCSYGQYMTQREAKSAAKQLMFAFSENRRHGNPFDMHLCNVNFNSDTFRTLERHIPTIRDDSFPLHLHEKSYLDLFPKDKLVYLTPHCTNDLEYDPESIYIVGAMVDKSNKEPLSQGKAKKQGIKMARLPLDIYLNWGTSSCKSLTLDQMMTIMLEIKTSQNWSSALKHVPVRKIARDDRDTNSKEWKPKFSPIVRSQTTQGSFQSEKPNLNFKFPRAEGSQLSTAEKFKRSPSSESKFRSSESKFHSSQPKFHSSEPRFQKKPTNWVDKEKVDTGMSTADKFKKVKPTMQLTDILKE
ncbi:Mitochondrial ribonuclease P protein 1 like [Pseudolycoriella hygida]|uniref:RNA (guanine-9-)-methyltransferase domain-containing protein 1 n=1 Tax=Pseudolycoriella hygida TaxID=35572 RepID=A0A9Q0MVV8_9DIPT|nr:Mitochondrial ribonuclease P protein 1 like [Pseudolycoriella hygida]